MGTSSISHTAANQRSAGWLGVAATALLLTACGDLTTYDKYADLQREDYTALAGRRGDAQLAPAEEPPIPELQQVIAAPKAPELADTRRVSVSVTDQTPLRDVLIELARKARVDLELDHRISGGIIFSATDRPLTEVIDRISRRAGLRYTFENNVLTVELDEPYIERYRLDFLNMSRTASSSSQTTTDVFSAVRGGGGGGTNTSGTDVSSSSDADLWGEVSEGISQILENTRPPELARIQGAQGAAFVPNAAEQTSSEQEMPAVGGQQLQQAANIANATANAANTETAQSGESAAANTGAGSQLAAQAQFSINKQAGLITIFGTQRQQEEVAKYIDDIRESVLQQVLIEAKIVEVSLADEFRTGIDWQSMGITTGGYGPGGPLVNGPDSLTFGSNFSRDVSTDTYVDPTLGLTWQNTDMDIQGVLSLVNAFGSVRTLSSPRLTVTNNQTAMLKVAENEVYFTIEVEQEDAVDNNPRSITVTSEINTVPIGLVMTVQPSINRDTKRISLNLKPVISRITRRISDPGVSIINAQVSSSIPIVETREIDSVVSLDSGQVVVMGGLMQEVNVNNREGIPGVMDLPLLGQAAGQRVRTTEVVELVIFLKATVVHDRDSVHEQDRELYNKFAPDPRPIAF